jgi:hypothetical protein
MSSGRSFSVGGEVVGGCRKWQWCHKGNSLKGQDGVMVVSLQNRVGKGNPLVEEE